MARLSWPWTNTTTSGVSSARPAPPSCTASTWARTDNPTAKSATSLTSESSAHTASDSFPERCSKQAITTTFIRPALAAPSAVSPSATVRRCSSRERPSGTRAADPRLKMTQEETVNHCPTMSMVELPLSFRPMPLQGSRNTQTWTDSPQLRKCRRLRMGLLSIVRHMPMVREPLRREPRCGCPEVTRFTGGPLHKWQAHTPHQTEDTDISHQLFTIPRPLTRSGGPWGPGTGRARHLTFNTSTFPPHVDPPQV